MKKYLVFSFSSIALGVGLTGLVAFAETTPSPVTTPATVSAPMMINIGPSGNVMLRGKVVSVDTTAGSLVVKSWGGSWTVEVASTTKILSKTSALSDFTAGDFVGVMGSVSEDGSFVINATILRAWGVKKDSDNDGIPDNQDENRMSFGKMRGGENHQQPPMMHSGDENHIPPPPPGIKGNRGPGSGDTNTGMNTSTGTNEQSEPQINALQAH